MNIFTRFLRDEHGFVLSAESVLLGSVGVIGATVGLGAVAESVNDELTDVAMAVRSLDQSYKVEGRSRCGAWVAGSQFTQTPVEQSLKELATEIDAAKAKIKADDDDDDRQEMKKDKDGDPPPPKKTKPGKNKKKDKDQDEDDSV